MNSCPRDILSDYYREALPTEDLEKVRLHVEGCEECRETVELFAAMESVVPEPPATFWASLPGKVTEETRSQSSPWSRLPVWAGGLAVAAAAVLFLTMAVPVTEVTENRVEEPFSSSTLFSLGLEEELLSLSGSDGAFIDRYLEEDEEEFALYEDQAGDPMDLLFESTQLEAMSPETVELFEKYLDEMIPNQMERG